MRQIIALGGGGFSMEPDNPLLDAYILHATRTYKPKVCFIPTASGDSEGYIERFYNSFSKLDCTPTHLSLFRPTFTDLRSFVLSQDAVYVGGGNTKNLLALWREWGLDIILREAWEKGIVLAGLSAGSLCWFEEGVTDSFGEKLEPLKCLGFLGGSHCPHYDGEINRRPSYQGMVAEGVLKPGLAADDGVALHFLDDDLAHIVSSRPDARAYRLTRNAQDGSALEEELVPDFLGHA
ncbi:Type 1 glutamine amidotransferase-like domain-containing protein [Alicyclobacillus dauci]|uniref:Type 1 glutamine amidotransferase-like domain-containing protein n=1 Tax=Alicyclobacillus dauci TaxID=1475485 RepID=A0ABY6YZN8_9BACL|nr:Type 1 glutamine amidotransferase-like domain-containing protein [Alicyclobacillus dauci]WAH36087.1 Type 1 glutamine amidotransferase-like domain-containing protein [Alicyclobacillus dauci]